MEREGEGERGERREMRKGGGDVIVLYCTLFRMVAHKDKEQEGIFFIICFCVRRAES